MGSFSWCYCDTGEIEIVDYGDYVAVRPTDEQRLITDDEEHPASVLFPKEFDGKEAQIDMSEYEDYGHFTKDIRRMLMVINRERRIQFFCSEKNISNFSGIFNI